MATLTLDRTPQGWDATSDVYDRLISPRTGQWAQTALELVNLSPGAEVLDVAAGPGALSLRAARLGMRVTATDFAPEMIARLRANATGEGLSIRAEVMDGQALDLPDASFDAAFSIFGLIFFPDRIKGFGELRRVLRPGARAVVAGWCSPDRFKVMGLVGQAMREALPDLPPPAEPPAAISLQDPAQFAAEMREAGFNEIHIVQVMHPFAFPSAEAAVEGLTNGAPPIKALMEKLDEAQSRAFLERLLKLCKAEFGDGPVAITSEANLGVGTK